MRSLTGPSIHLEKRPRGSSHDSFQDVAEGGVQAVCSCGWRSPVFGADKTTGTMDPLQRAADARDLHE